MWRHGHNGNFNVGYGGEERRWVVTHKNIIDLSKALSKAKPVVSDFENILDEVKDGDFIFLDPPYKPGQKELKESHYAYSKFTFNDQIRLSNKLNEIGRKQNIRWLMTNSAQNEVCNLYMGCRIQKIPNGTSERIGIYTENSKEVLISNF